MNKFLILAFALVWIAVLVECVRRHRKLYQSMKAFALTLQSPTVAAATLPVPASAIPDVWISELCGGELDDLSYGQGYRDGFNHCRTKILAAQALHQPLV